MLLTLRAPRLPMTRVCAHASFGRPLCRGAGSPMISLAGKAVIVTGAGSGIGRAYATALSAAGANVTLVGRSQARLDAVAQALPTASEIVAGDVADISTGQLATARTLDRFGRLDVVIANAGLYVGGAFVETELATIQQLLAVNIFGVMSVVRSALPTLLEQGTGDVLVTSSVSGHQAIHWEPVYSATKHAVQAFVHTLRRQLVGTGVRLGAIAPGVVLNELWGFAEGDARTEEKLSDGSGILSSDVADAVVFMLTRPRHVTIRDLVILPSAQEI